MPMWKREEVQAVLHEQAHGHGAGGTGGGRAACAREGRAVPADGPSTSTAGRASGTSPTSSHAGRRLAAHDACQARREADDVAGPRPVPGRSDVRSRWRSYGTLYGVFTPAEETLIRVAALRFLEAEAQLVKLGLDEEERRRPAEPEHPVLRALAGKLEALRKQLRRSAWPRAGSAWGAVKLALEDDPGELQYWEEGLILGIRGEPIHPRVVISLERWRRQLSLPSCSCSHHELRTGCIHRLSAVDAFLALLPIPPAARSRTGWPWSWSCPMGARAASGRFIEAEHVRQLQGRDEVRFSYRIGQSVAGRVWGVQPVLHKRRKGGDYTSGKSVGSRGSCSNSWRWLPRRNARSW